MGTKLSLSTRKEGKYGKLPDTVTIDKLHKFTNFTRDQIYDLLERFRHIAVAKQIPKLDSSQEIEEEENGTGTSFDLDIKTFGGLNCKDFLAVFKLPDGEVGRQCFHLFDSNGDGLVDFRDFVTALSMCYSGNLEEKLGSPVCFNMWDYEGNGYLTIKELHSMVKYMVRLGDIIVEDEATSRRVSLTLAHSPYVEELDGMSPTLTPDQVSEEDVPLNRSDKMLPPTFDAPSNSNSGISPAVSESASETGSDEERTTESRSSRKSHRRRRRHHTKYKSATSPSRSITLAELARPGSDSEARIHRSHIHSADQIPELTRSSTRRSRHHHRTRSRPHIRTSKSPIDNSPSPDREPSPASDDTSPRPSYERNAPPQIHIPRTGSETHLTSSGTSTPTSRSSSSSRFNEFRSLPSGNIKDIWKDSNSSLSPCGVIIRAKNEELEEKVAHFVKGIFEEAALEHSDRITFAEAWAKENPLVTHFLRHFNVMLIAEAEREEQEEYEKIERSQLDVSWHCPKVDPSIVKSMSLDDLNWLRKLGEGSYGDVWLVQYKDTPLLFAMKCVKKKKLVNESMMAQARAERDALLSNTHPFIVHMYRTFRDDAFVYLLFEYVAGGELENFFRANKRCFDLQTTKFYAAELLLALEYLHEFKGITHRDIKLNNIMINSDGHLRLCDFGFAKHLDRGESTYTLVGTPEYLAIDVLKGKGYTMACDWWSFGVLIWKMLNGHGPFYRPNRSEIFSAILEAKLVFPAHFDDATRDLLKSLLNPNDKKRLGSRKGTKEIKHHPWFQDIDWEKLQREEVLPPFVPALPEKLYDKLEDRIANDIVPESYKKLFLDF